MAGDRNIFRRASDLALLFLSDMWKPVNLNTFPLTIRNPVLVWRVLLQQSSQAIQRHNIGIPLKTLGNLIPYLKLCKWVERGLMWVYDLFNGTTLRDILILKQEYDKFTFILIGKFLSKTPSSHSFSQLTGIDILLLGPHEH